MKKLFKFFGIIAFVMALSISLITSKSINNNGKSIKLNSIFVLGIADAEDICQQVTCHKYRCSNGLIGCSTTGELSDVCTTQGYCN